MREFKGQDGHLCYVPDENHQFLIVKKPFPDEVWFQMDIWELPLALRLITIGYDIDPNTLKSSLPNMPSGSRREQNYLGMAMVLSRAEKIARSSIAAGKIKDVDTPENWIHWAKSKGYITEHIERALDSDATTVTVNQTYKDGVLYIEKIASRDKPPVSAIFDTGSSQLKAHDIGQNSVRAFVDELQQRATKSGGSFNPKQAPGRISDFYKVANAWGQKNIDVGRKLTLSEASVDKYRKGIVVFLQGAKRDDFYDRMFPELMP